MTQLSEKKCLPCQGGIPPLTIEQITSLLSQIDQEWQVIENHHLEKNFKFSNFIEALEFTNKVGKLAEEEGHHPDIYLSWGKVGIKIWTHKIDGLNQSDFILAAKIDQID